MKDCEDFESKLQGSIPNRFRSESENSLRSFQESRIMLNIYSRALKACSIPTFPRASKPLVIAFGSFGRLDGSANISDYDVLFIYPGNKNIRYIENIHQLIREIVTHNRALKFDHRNEIERGTFDFGSSFAYPVLSTNELMQTNNRIRALQAVTEGRIILNEPKGLDIKCKFIRKFGFTKDIHSLDLSELRNSLDMLKNEFCSKIIGRLVTDGNKLNNPKILKLFALREFFYLSTLFSVSEIALRVVDKSATIKDSAKILSAPSILKISSFHHSTGVLSSILSKLSPATREQLYKCIKDHVKNVSSEVLPVIEDKHLDKGETLFLQSLRTLALSVLLKYDGLIYLVVERKKDYIENTGG